MSLIVATGAVFGAFFPPSNAVFLFPSGPQASTHPPITLTALYSSDRYVHSSNVGCTIAGSSSPAFCHFKSKFSFLQPGFSF